MNRTHQKIAALSLAFALLASPAVSFAKNKGNDNENKHSEKAERKEEQNENKEEKKAEKKINKDLKTAWRACLKDLRPLTSRSDFTSFIACITNLNNSATSTDTTAPVISNLLAKPNNVKASVTWQTNENSDSAVYISTAPNVVANSSSTLNVVKNERVKNHSVLIENLSASTTYYLLISSKDAAGNTATSSEISFKTHSPLNDATPPVISALSYLPSTTTVMVSWKTDENASSRIYFGTTHPLVFTASSTATVVNSTLAKDHLLQAANLSTSTTYYFAVESLDASGNKATSPTFTVITQ